MLQTRENSRTFPVELLKFHLIPPTTALIASKREATSQRVASLRPPAPRPGDRQSFQGHHLLVIETSIHEPTVYKSMVIMQALDRLVHGMA
jgi:hypothetical protein